MLRRLYDWTMSLASGRHAPVALGAVSFAESSFFPIPPDILLIPMVIAQRAKAFAYATLCTVTSVLGGAAGYAIGAFLFLQVAEPILAFYGYLDKFETFRGNFNDYGAWIVFIAGVTPFPYKVITIASGVTRMDFLVFMLASGISRGARFFLVAALLWRFGPPIRFFIEAHLGKLTAAFFILLVGGFVALKYLL